MPATPRSLGGCPPPPEEEVEEDDELASKGSISMVVREKEEVVQISGVPYIGESHLMEP